MPLKIRRLTAGAAASLAALLVAGAPAHAGPATADLVFNASHFAKIADGRTVTYNFVRTANGGANDKLEPSFEDKVSILVGPQGNANSVRVDLFSGKRAQQFENLSKTGNPVIVAVLEQDVKEMNKALGGSPFYFRNRLRQALTEDTSSQPTRIEFGGKTHDGWKVTLKPFANDPQNAYRLKEYAQRSYELTFSDDVPGGLYALKTVTPKADGGNLLVEELTLRGEGAAEPAAAEPASKAPAEGTK